ncbi:MAG: molybdopterin synthase sulfur carrier subunit [Flavobacteriaceae bacterium]|jgi:molybdopterin synthase sulfur carrier subunit
MNLKIRYFGLLAEITNRSEETIAFSKASVSDLLELLFEKYPELKEKDFQVAQDLEIVSKDTLLLESEIALLPPFSGG